MKKRFVVTLLALVMIAFLMVSCVQKGPEAPAAPDAATFVATPGIGVVELNWGEVPGATFYDIVINLVQPAGKRAEQTQWTERVAAPPYTFVVEVAGTYSWTVAAGNNAGTSDPVAGDNFTGTPVAEEPTYDTPTVEITSPTEGAKTTLTPTIEWTAVPGTVTEAEARGYAIDSCEVVIKEGTTEIATGAGVQGVGNAWSYDVPTDTLVFGKAYTVEVTASQEGAENDGVDTVNFNTPAELELELSATTTYECDTIIATVTANNTDINKVAIFGKLPADLDFQKLAPEGENWREPNAVTRKAVFTLSATELGAGVWTINAQALGNAAESQDETLTIQEIMPAVSMSLQVCEKDVENGQYVCYDPEAGTPTAVYSVDVTVPEDMVEFIEEYTYTFDFYGNGSEYSEGPVESATTTESASTEISIDLATECTKLATVTIFGTTTCASTFTDVATMMFVLDGAVPTATITANPVSVATETIVFNFAATDTKSLCEAEIEFFVEKEDVDGTQMWDSVFVPWGETSFDIETISGEATYTGELGKGATPNISGTATLTLSELDCATVTATLTVSDCCDVSCCDACGDPIERDPVTAVATAFIDNVVYKVELVNVSFFDKDSGDVYADLGDDWLITTESSPASAIFTIADAATTTATVTVDDSALTISATYASASDTEAPCTGYPFKQTKVGTITATPAPATETSVIITVSATDANGNVKEATQTVIIDTMPPTLTIVQGLKNEGYGREALQFSFRDADSDQDVTCLGATVTVFGYLPEYYDNDSGDVIVRVDENDSKTWIIDPLSKNGALDLTATLTLNVLAKDKYGNEAVSTLIGNVIPYAPER